LSPQRPGTRTTPDIPLSLHDFAVARRATGGMIGRSCTAACCQIRRDAGHDVRMAELTPRLRRRIGCDFPAGSAERVISYLEALAESAFDGQGRERVQAAVVIASRGQWDRFRSMLRLLELDWRDVLMAGGLGQGDWRAVLDAELGPTDDAAAT
jgi:hypothetical protein